MSLTLPKVISFWGVGNAVLAGVLIAYREDAFGVALYASSVALVEIVAIAAWWSASRFRNAALVTPAPRHGHVAVVAASAVPFIGLGLVWRPYMAIPAVYPLLDLVTHAIRALRRPLPEPEVVAVAAPPPPTAVKVAASVGAVTVSVALARRLRRHRE